MPTATSPASSGPAGPLFEGQVAASYLLAMLVGAEPRGLPGTSIDRIELQRAAEGHPLDDVAVHAHDPLGAAAVLDIQVKRSITFAPSDPVFRAVVHQIAETARAPEFRSMRYELAIATAQTSRKIAGPYQDVLTWARQLDSATTFMARINRAGSASDDMCTFVGTFRSHLAEAGAPHDDEHVWLLLSRLQILVFGYTAPGSAHEDHARERAARALEVDETPRAAALWSTLVELAMEIAASGGDRTRERLVADLVGKSYRLLGDRRHVPSRTALAEASRQALDDIADRVRQRTLSRQEHVTRVRSALASARCIEIRGDAGVGKSALLRHFAEQAGEQARIIVASPGRITPRGWTALRSVLGFDGTARELLVDLAADGGALLFIDNLDFFTEDERTTVVDLVRAAADVPGTSVVATARPHFGVDEPSWLPADALRRLGGTTSLLIGELTDAEVDELRRAAPELAALLADTHPARHVTRNLFRLARLADRPADAPAPRSEIDMAEQWWTSADGLRDDTHRDRARLLRSLAEQALVGADPLDVRLHPARAIEALIKSETLRDYGNDRVAFRHDVLREWAIANLLHAEPERLPRLPLNRPAPARLARALELAARFALERAPDSAGWQALLQQVSQGDAHGSWRRAALMAVVRSEVADELLARISGQLHADSAALLRELMRLVIAVDVEPARNVLVAAGIDAEKIPDHINVPSTPSWHRLIRWLLALGDNFPAAALPEAIDLFRHWSIGMFGREPITPLLQARLHRWLVDVEGRNDLAAPEPRQPTFAGDLDYRKASTLAHELRTSFFLFSHRSPQLAAEYLQALLRDPHRKDVCRRILQFRGSLAQAAPAELAELTAATLIAEPEERTSCRRGYDALDDALDYVDKEFMPASPAQGPFFELLTHAPRHGLALIRRLVGHVIEAHSDGNAFGADALVVAFPEADRAFPWIRSYAWARQSNYYSITSALMALEAWAHHRVETGEQLEAVLADVIGDGEAPAAFVLVAVDLILSHWPQSRAAAVPFLACPELLCLDRQRALHDTMPDPDLFGLRALQKEPIGLVTAEQLKARPSRRNSLDQMLGLYAVQTEDDTSAALGCALRRAAERLGPPSATSDLGDPELMTVHALNLIDPSNYRQVTLTRDDGTEIKALQYVSPPDEDRHLAALRTDAGDPLADANMQAFLRLALDDPKRATPELIESAVAWVQKPAPIGDERDRLEAAMHDQAVVAAAMITMRDGTTAQRTQHRAWASGVFAAALQTENDHVRRHRAGLAHNPVATALVGIVHAHEGPATREILSVLLKAATRDDAAAAQGLSVVSAKIKALDERLPRALLRVALTACIRPRRNWDLEEEEVKAKAEIRNHRLRAAVDAELAWLADDGAEPTWPMFPSETPHVRRGIRLGPRLEGDGQPAVRRKPPEIYVDYQGAALWLSNTAAAIDEGNRSWMRELVRLYADWTATANGAGLERHNEVSNPPREWNEAYFALLAHCLPGMTFAEIEQLALKPMASLPDESFLDVVSRFLRSCDAVLFNHNAIEIATAVEIRSALAERLILTRAWRSLARSETSSIEMRLGPAAAVFFFNDYSIGQMPSCYLFPRAIEKVDDLIPLFQRLVVSAPSFFIAIVTLNLLEVAHRSEHLPLMISALMAWLDGYPDNGAFWVDHNIGRRACAWIEAMRKAHPTQFAAGTPTRADIDRLLAAMVSLGIADAARLEAALIAI